jgi:hypothetical protein
MEVFMRRMLLTGPIVLSLVMPVLGAAVPPVNPNTPNPTPPAGSTPSLVVTGKITTGIMAIGAETAGITLNDGKMTYELDIKDATMKKAAENLNGKQVTVKGRLTLKAGIEVGQRRIITVESLEEAAATAPATRP